MNGIDILLMGHHLIAMEPVHRSRIFVGCLKTKTLGKLQLIGFEPGKEMVSFFATRSTVHGLETSVSRSTVHGLETSVSLWTVHGLEISVIQLSMILLVTVKFLLSRLAAECGLAMGQSVGVFQLTALLLARVQLSESQSNELGTTLFFGNCQTLKRNFAENQQIEWDLRRMIQWILEPEFWMMKC